MCLPVSAPSKCKRKYSVCFRNDACMGDSELLQSAIKGDMSSPMQSRTVNYRIDRIQWRNGSTLLVEARQVRTTRLSRLNLRVSLRFLVSSNHPWMRNCMMALSIPRRYCASSS
ncbi:hypothetical protein B296_00046069 [Ensete ventricosum]|uniref:Uncharacterized protein n=1 Tax=Ensete ventricosum TaxID=4639 RepID=A0A426XLA4_ENSVE|nr:hypothetical protein B296_00046069 [Ensete ventricosum]